MLSSRMCGPRPVLHMQLNYCAGRGWEDFNKGAESLYRLPQTVPLLPKFFVTFKALYPVRFNKN